MTKKTTVGCSQKPIMMMQYLPTVLNKSQLLL